MKPVELTRSHVRDLMPVRPPDAHKGMFGHVFVLAGSHRFAGAAKMTGLSAARSGAGLVTLGVPHPLLNAVVASVFELMVFPMRATRADSISVDAAEEALAFAQDKSAVAIGPGLSQHPDTQAFVHRFVAENSTPMVVDADALNAIAGHLEYLDRALKPPILTPHPGEMARLCGCSTGEIQADRAGIAARFARAHRCVVVLKGPTTVVADHGGELFVNTTGNSGMATGGTGDILTGILAGLLAQGLAPFDAARLGVYLHGLAGDLAASAKTERGMIAGDLLDCIPAAWRILEGTFDP